jgi:hypothetical protein
MSGEITVRISPDGSQVKMEGDHFQGTGCEDLMKGTMEALGSVSDSKRKPEFYTQGGTGVSQGH